MNSFDPAGHDQEKTRGTSSGGTSRRQPILGHLDELTTLLASLREGPLPPESDHYPLTLWQDGKNVYINAELKSHEEMDVDITICYGKVFIRVAR